MTVSPLFLCPPHEVPVCEWSAFADCPEREPMGAGVPGKTYSCDIVMHNEESVDAGTRKF